MWAKRTHPPKLVTHRILVLKQALIVSRQRHHEKKTLNTFKTMNPFLALGPLSTDVHHSEVELAQFEKSLRDTCRSKTGM